MAVCTVSFSLIDLAEEAIEGAIIEASTIDPSESGTSLIGGKRLTATTDVNGAAEIDLVQGTADVKIRILVPDGSEGLTNNVFTITVPASSSANFTDLIG